MFDLAGVKWISSLVFRFHVVLQIFCQMIIFTTESAADLSKLTLGLVILNVVKEIFMLASIVGILAGNWESQFSYKIG